MARMIDDDELIRQWTLVGEELAQVAGKRGATRLGFACLLKFFTLHGRFPRGRGELPRDAVGYVASQVDVPPAELGFYEWSGRTFEYHRRQVRTFLGFRECTVADADKLTEWLTTEVCQRERRFERVRDELMAHCRTEGIEPPAPGRVGRIIGSALRQAEEMLTRRVAERIPPEVAAAITRLVRLRPVAASLPTPPGAPVPGRAEVAARALETRTGQGRDASGFAVVVDDDATAAEGRELVVCAFDGILPTVHHRGGLLALDVGDLPAGEEAGNDMSGGQLIVLLVMRAAPGGVVKGHSSDGAEVAGQAASQAVRSTLPRAACRWRHEQAVRARAGK